MPITLVFLVFISQSTDFPLLPSSCTHILHNTFVKHVNDHLDAYYYYTLGPLLCTLALGQKQPFFLPVFCGAMQMWVLYLIHLAGYNSAQVLVRKAVFLFSINTISCSSLTALSLHTESHPFNFQAILQFTPGHSHSLCRPTLLAPCLYFILHIYIHIFIITEALPSSIAGWKAPTSS